MNKVLVATLLTLAAQSSLAQNIQIRSTNPNQQTNSIYYSIKTSKQSADSSQILKDQTQNKASILHHQNTGARNNNLNRAQQQLLKSGGGADTGGGNTLGSSKVHRDDVLKYISLSPQILPYVLRKLEFLSSQMVQLNDQTGLIKPLFTKLFKGPKTIYQALNEAQFVAQPKGACLDKEDNEVDASVKDAPHICFSLERLSQKLNEDSIQTEIIAIALHEVSHLVGTTEAEANMLQFLSKSSLIKDPFNKIPNHLEEYQSRVNEVFENVSLFSKSVRHTQLIEICGWASALMGSIAELNQKNMNAVQNVGVLYSSPREIWLLTAATVKGANLLGLCRQDRSAFEEIDAAYGKRNEMSLREFYKVAYKATSAGSDFSVLPNIPVRKVTYKNLKSAELEISDIQNLLYEVVNNL